jgi:HAMP domain-containing protein
MFNKLKNLKLQQKFTILLLLILVGASTLSGIALNTVLKRNVQNEISSTALILMEQMNSVREYTSSQVKPELTDRLESEFLPETVPAYSAREVFENFRKNPDYRDFFYKEATLNPTNLRDKADSFETKIVKRFRNEKDTKELKGFRSAPSGDIFYIARPLAVSKSSCLECHSTPEAAPKSQIERYGTSHGFGWQLNEIVSAQMISVPASKVVDKANQSFFLIMGIVSIGFIAVIFLVNVLLKRQIIRPLKRMARVAEEVSIGNLDAEFERLSNDEVGNLAKAFKRMKLSLEIAMKRLNRSRGGEGNQDQNPRSENHQS